MTILDDATVPRRTAIRELDPSGYVKAKNDEFASCREETKKRHTCDTF